MIRLRSGIQVIGLALSRRGLQTRINMSGPVETSIRSKINSKLTPEHLDVINESYMHNVPKGSESHFKVVVVSSQFENKPLIQRHRMVNEALSEEFNSGLHALSIEAKTPSQWADSNKKLFHSGEIVDLTNEDETDLPLAGGDTVKSVLAVKKVERLFGRGALAQGFYSPAKKLPPSNTIPLEGNNPRPARSMESFPEATQGNSAHLVTTTEPGNSQVKEIIGNPQTNCFDINKGVENLSVKSNFDKDCGDSEKNESPELPTFLKSDNLISNKGKCDNHERALITKWKVKDGHYFLKILDEKVDILEEIANKCEGNIELCKVEESKGELRSVAGKARLLVNEKFNQFRGLCKKNISSSDLDTFPTTNEDLEGFWDMISIQIDDITSKYETAKTLKENDWQMPQTKIRKFKVMNKNQIETSKPLRTIQPVKAPEPVMMSKSNTFRKDQSEIINACNAERRKILKERRLAEDKFST